MDRELKIGCIGTRGHYGQALAELEQIENVRLAAMSPGGDSAEGIKEWCNKRGEFAEYFENYQQMLEKGGLDLVIVCGPFEKHAEMTIAAMERGIHVLCEKPVALKIADLEQLKRCAEKNPRVLLAGMMFSRYEPGFFTAHQLVSSGAIGEIRLINARKSYKMGKRAEYYHSRSTYGGTIPWVGSHAIDWVLWFLGKQPRSVCAMHSRIGNGGHGEMESSALCQFLFDNDVAVSISIDVLRPPGAPTHGDDWMRLVGTRGVMEVRPTEIHLINDENDGSRKVPVASDRTLVGDLIEEIRGGKKGLIDAAQTLELTEMCLRARDAADGNGKAEFKKH